MSSRPICRRTIWVVLNGVEIVNNGPAPAQLYPVLNNSNVSTNLEPVAW
jgi:hypothetical protein